MSSLTLYINGLALCHFNSRNKSWNVSFPKVEKHHLQIVVKKNYVLDGNNMIQLSKHFIPEGQAFVIKANGQTFNTGGNFPDIINLSRLIGKKPLLPEDIDNTKIAGKAILQGFKLNPFYLSLTFPKYLVRPASNEYNYYDPWETRGPSPQIPSTHKIKLTPLQVKNSLKSDEINILQGEEATIKIGNNVHETITHSENVRYEIFLYNNCDENPGGCEDKSDFPEYYKILKPAKPMDLKDVELLKGEVSPSSGDRTGCDIATLP